MLNPDHRFEDDGETPKTWSEDELIRQVPVQGLRLGFKPGSRMRSIVKLFLRRLKLQDWIVYVDDEGGFRLTQAMFNEADVLDGVWDTLPSGASRRTSARRNERQTRHLKQILSNIVPNVLSRAEELKEMVDAQNAQHHDSMDVDNDSEPALADPDATMVEENEDDSFMPYSPMLPVSSGLPPVTPRKQLAPQDSLPTPTSMNREVPVRRQGTNSANTAIGRATVDEDPFAPPPSNTSNDAQTDQHESTAPTKANKTEKLRKKLKVAKTMKAVSDERRRTSDIRRIAAKRAAEERLREEKKVSGEKDATIQNQKLVIECLIRARDLLVKRVKFWRGLSKAIEAKRVALQERMDKAFEHATNSLFYLRSK